MKYEHRKRVVVILDLAEKLRKEVCTLNDEIDHDLTLKKLSGVAGQKEGMAIKKAQSKVDLFFSAISGFPEIQFLLEEGGF